MGQNTFIADLTVCAELGDQRAQRLLGLSFYYGPDGACADSLEVFWQVGKVFSHHDAHIPT